MSNMYESGSLGSQFKPHQQGPKGLPASAFGSISQPSALVVTKKPNSVILFNSI